jgi:hypothetical protein
LIWKKYQDEATYKMFFTKGAEAIAEFKASGWLSDIRKEGVVGTSLSSWMQQEILPKAMKNGLKKIAVVMDADIFKEFYVDSIKKNTGNEMMRYFDSVESANEWLRAPVEV